jgi:hypothetical protein
LKADSANDQNLRVEIEEGRDREVGLGIDRGPELARKADLQVDVERVETIPKVGN